MAVRPVRLALILLGLLTVFAGLRGIHGLLPDATESELYTDRVVVVGVTGRYQPDPTDARILAAHADRVQVGAVSVRPRYVGDCAAAGWTTLGAGRRAAVGGLCQPEVSGGLVTDWPMRQGAIRARNGDARLGTLARSVRGCVAAVGPGAALAAARPGGTVADYRTVEAFSGGGFTLGCPITLVDAGPASDEVIRALAGRPEVTLIVTGIGPATGSNDPGLQLIYRVGTTLPGWLTSASTRRPGVVTINDLTRTLIDFGTGGSPGAAAKAVDGAPLAVVSGTVSPDRVHRHLRSLAALSDQAPIGYLSLGAGGLLFFVTMIICLIRRRYAPARLVGALAAVLTAVMMLTGSAPWQDASRPGLFLSLLIGVLALMLTSVALLGARLARVPVAVAAAALTMAAFTADAALGAVMQPGSMLNSRPIFALRWYGFGNVTFAAYAAAGLVLAYALASRLRLAGRPRLAGGTVLLVGLVVIICEGWPGMGTDFGGVIALTPGVLWLAYVVSGVHPGWQRLLGIGLAAVVAISVISLLDWHRPPDARSHLGDFVQRIIDGDAGDVVFRKAVASLHTIISPLGIGSLVVGVGLWLVIFRYALPRIEVLRLRPVAVAALGTAILGTLLNDGGISVWLTLTAAFSVTCLSLWLDRVAEVGSVRLPRAAEGRSASEPTVTRR
ncbi:hypothetical protein GCM10009841_00340 [Microlunatus panaciterrae]|uniref:Uncharacterized protein n=1 Tax=Microlunatus panaciterrae TaxID=400768 RepID=A0ABS2RL68_9ACTN|nr:hypothetical protein [Microlunatus panaciterrae]MBM7799317.1 hypothetical protein [Microlunatus panaciterrae]